MSLRSTTRVARSVRLPVFTPRVPVIARRAASSGEHHAAPGSDLPWAIGSAVVFIPSFAYFLTKKDDDHHEHAAHAILDLPTDQFGRKGEVTEIVNFEAEASESDKEGAEPVGVKATVEEVKDSAVEKFEEAKDKAGEVKEAAEEKVEDVKEGAKDAVENVKEDAKDVAQDAEEGVEKTAEEVKESLEQAEKADYPQSA